MPKKTKMRLASPAWEIGRVQTGLGAKVGGLGVIVEELPPELVKAAAKQNIDLEIETLSPCFAHYDKSQLTNLNLHFPVTIDGYTFAFETYKYTFPDGQTVIYFWDEWQLSWTNANAIYPANPLMAYRLYAAVSQAMAGYIKQGNFDVVHSHDYHVGLVPFYLGDDYLQQVAHHFTIHNASYQGLVPAEGRGYEALYDINLPGHELFHKYFDYFDYLNFMKGAMIKTHESGGKITTVSGDIAGTWGYAAELRQNAATVWAKAQAQKWWGSVGEVFVPNRHLDAFEKLPIAGITNGMGDRNRPENLPELKASVLQEQQKKRPHGAPIFNNPYVQQEMLSKNHNFKADSLEIKHDLKRLLHLEAFGTEPMHDPLIITVVGRLVGQKNLGLVADIIEPTLAYDPGTKFVMLASAPQGDAAAMATEHAFFTLSQRYPQRVYFNNGFNLPLSKLIFAGGDFTLIPSRFEPCGLVDYEASLLGNVVIGRLTGGLAKVNHCGYLYEWLDVSDRTGEANAFLDQIKYAIDTYRHDPGRHAYLLQMAMDIEASWDKSAAQYIHMYRYGALIKRWETAQRNVVSDFVKSLKKDESFFSEFFTPAHPDFQESLDWLLKLTLENNR